MQIAKNLKQFRKEQKLSLAELAEMAGVTKQSISYFENCDRCPSFEVGMKIAKALGITAEELAYGKSEKENVK